MKRWLSLWLILVILAMGIMPALGEGSGSAAEEVDNEIVVGSLTAMSGYFFTDMWGNNSSDMDIRAMVHGYGTVAWVKDGDFVIDPTIVTDVQYADDKSGNRTYTFTLNEELQYNDGTPVLARDYVFAVLLRSSPLILELGGTNQAFNHLMGFESYQEGGPFTGVRLLGEREFSLTIKRTSLPYFYEMQMVNVEPAPMDIIAPGFTVADVGKGAYIIAKDEEGIELEAGEDAQSVVVEEGGKPQLVAEMLRETLLDPETGYVTHPGRTCGPYQLLSYDAETRVAELQINHNYLGNYEGQKPEIERVTFMAVQPETMFEDLKSGRVDLINKVSNGDAVNEGMRLRADEGFSMLNYPRAGLNMLAFACELGPTQSKDMRKAISMCIDEHDLCETYLQGYGIPVYAYYGLGQWMSQEWMKDDADAMLQLCIYSLNLNQATRLLEDDGWVYDEQGEPYTVEEGEIKVRYRQNAEGEPLERLTIRIALPEGSSLVPYIQENMVENLKKIGVDAQSDVLPFPELLRQYYRQDERVYNVMLIATNFQYVFDPYYTFNTGDIYQGVHNTTGIRDEKLMKLADAMRRVAPGEKGNYLTRWMEFQQYWIDALPMYPLYSNVYFDFFRDDLQNYMITSSNTWAAAILYSYLGEPREEEGELLGGVALDEEGMDGEETVILD